MTSRKTAFALGFCTSLLWAGIAQAQSPYPVVQGKYYKFEKVADGVYYASPEFNGTAFPFGSNPFFGANLVVIVNKDDVVLVDSATSPRAARALLADIKRLTDKPVRYVVNTHWHYDHTDGNSVFRARKSRSSRTSMSARRSRNSISCTTSRSAARPAMRPRR
jgi:hypothetical protein